MDDPQSARGVHAADRMGDARAAHPQHVNSNRYLHYYKYIHVFHFISVLFSESIVSAKCAWLGFMSNLYLLQQFLFFVNLKGNIITLPMLISIPIQYYGNVYIVSLAVLCTH